MMCITHLFQRKATSTNVRTIVASAYPSKIILQVIVNRLNAKAEELLAEEQAGFRSGRNTVEQIFNGGVIIKKHLQHQRKLLHNFKDFKKAFESLACRPVADPQKLQHR